jgi:uncharacterized protein (UPF0332 family)
MRFLWRDYLTLAEALIHARHRFAPSEARYRAAISRAYYAAYGAARQHAKEHEGYTPAPTGRDHRLLVAHYQRGPRSTQHQIGRTLQRLMDNRLQADYDEDIPADVRQLALASAQEARQVFGWLQQLWP